MVSIASFRKSSRVSSRILLGFPQSLSEPGTYLEICSEISFPSPPGISLCGCFRYILRDLLVWNVPDSMIPPVLFMKFLPKFSLFRFSWRINSGISPTLRFGVFQIIPTEILSAIISGIRPEVPSVPPGLLSWIPSEIPSRMSIEIIVAIHWNLGIL